MRRLITLAASAALFSTLALAETWTGKLVDGGCANPDKTAKECNVGSSTSTFLLIVDGKAYSFDQTGNKMAVDALKNRADRAADPNNPKSSQIMAKVTGDKDGDVLKVAAVEVQ